MSVNKSVTDLSMKDQEFNAYAFAFQLGFRIVTPLLIATFGGLWLDQKFDSRPWFFLGLMLAAFLLTMIMLYRASKETIARASQKNPEHEEKKEKK